MTIDRSAIDYWDARATRWRVAAPLSPGAQDERYFADRAREAAAGSTRPLRALLLGVTPIIGGMDWPDGASVAAIDWSGGMFSHVWSGPAARKCAGVRADWRRMPFADGSIDFAVGDGCYSTFATLEGARALNHELARVLRRGAIACIRCFTRPDEPEALDALFGELANGLANLDLFRWRLAMALHGTSGEGISLQEVWRAWHERVPDPEAHPARKGWDTDAVANIEGWRTATARYLFPTLGELRAIAAPAFELERSDFADYAWAERFPRLVLRRR